jgi:hypothetical protein
MHLFSKPVLAVAALILSARIYAQQQTTAVPRWVRFNGSYHAANPQAQIGATVATFTIYRDESSLTPLWSEVQPIEPDNDGQSCGVVRHSLCEAVALHSATSSQALDT